MIQVDKFMGFPGSENLIMVLFHQFEISSGHTGHIDQIQNSRHLSLILVKCSYERKLASMINFLFFIYGVFGVRETDHDVLSSITGLLGAVMLAILEKK